MALLKKDGGFTLIEIIVSMVLIPLIWFAVSVPLSVNTMLISQSRHRAQAVLIAQQLIDQMRAGPYTSLAETPRLGVTIDDRGTVTTADDLTGEAAIFLGTETIISGGRYRQVTATVRWNESTVGGLPRALTESLATIISDDSAG